ncbi:ankyrin repeat domain-containing protein, partial [Brachyspira sp.]|uniref:ankyrin repeat domain-containing protein n=1 Tax=Brachyspira sp. TaxID=1977261 RepID=UPI003D7DE0EF
INSLYDAIKENNPKKIIDIVNNYKIDLNNVFYVPQDVSFDGGGGYGTVANISPLIYAIECQNIEAIDTLLKLGANVGQLTDIYTGYDEEDFIILDDYTNRISITPLMYAAYSSTEEVISFLIKKGAKVNVKDRKGRTALMYGPSEALIRAGANVNAKDNEGKTALMYWQNEALISAGANVNAKDNNGWTALMYACDGIGVESVIKNPDIIKSLIRAGANINEVNNYGDTALMWAILTYRSAVSDDYYSGRELNDYTLPTFETIRFLIYNGANVNIRNKKGETPLSLAKELPQLTKLLKDNGAY